MAEIPPAVNREEILAGVNPAGSAPADGVLKSVAASLPTTVVDAIDQQNNEGKIHQTTEERLKKQIKSKPKNNEQKEIFYKPTNLNRTDLYKEYGNNYFELRTIDNSTEIILAGILKEFPEFSCSTEWEEGPGGTIGKKITEYVNDDTLQALNFIDSSNYNNLIAMDALTERIYAKTNYGNFELNFRIYPNQIIGSTELTSPKIWIKSLLKFTSPDASVGTISKTVVGNLKTSVESVDGFVKDIKKLISVDDKNKDNNAKTASFNSFAEKLDNISNKSLDKRYGDNRVYTESNGKGKFGAKLFALTIMPFIFKQSLKVYISDWSVNPSSECYITSENKHEHVYYDFKITCCMDQIPSKDTWYGILGYDKKPEESKKDKK